MRRAVGRVIEWFLRYEHVVSFKTDNQRPRTGYVGDAGYDLYVSRDIDVPPRSVVDIPTGVYIDPKDWIWFEIKARSSTFKKRGMEVQDAIIDRGYRGEMFAVVHNPSDVVIKVKKDERICQVVPHRLIPCKFVSDGLSSSDRGLGGFGSSGR